MHWTNMHVHRVTCSASTEVVFVRRFLCVVVSWYMSHNSLVKHMKVYKTADEYVQVILTIVYS